MVSRRWGWGLHLLCGLCLALFCDVQDLALAAILHYVWHVFQWLLSLFFSCVCDNGTRCCFVSYVAQLEVQVSFLRVAHSELGHAHSVAAGVTAPTS